MMQSIEMLSETPMPQPVPLIVADNYSSPVVMTYVTGFFNADTNPGAKVFLLTINGKYSLCRPIIVSLKEEDAQEYIACFEEAELSRSGETAHEAIDWLRSSIVTLYDLLRKKNPNKLGPLPTRQLKVLRDYLVTVSPSKA